MHTNLSLCLFGAVMWIHLCQDTNAPHAELWICHRRLLSTIPIFCRPAQGQKDTNKPLNIVTHYRGRAYDAALRADVVLAVAADNEHVHAVVVPPMAAPGSSGPATCLPRLSAAKCNAAMRVSCRNPHMAYWTVPAAQRPFPLASLIRVWVASATTMVWHSLVPDLQREQAGSIT